MRGMATVGFAGRLSGFRPERGFLRRLRAMLLIPSAIENGGGFSSGILPRKPG